MRWLIEEYAPRIYNFAPDRYFYPSQAPLIYISYSTELNDLPDTDYFKTEFESNSFVKNRNIQIELLPALIYKASLIIYDSKIPSSRFDFINNEVVANKHLGR